MEDVAVVGVCDVVAEVVGFLADAARVAAAHGDLLAPDGARGARSEDVVLGAEEEVRDELAADAACDLYGEASVCVERAWAGSMLLGWGGFVWAVDGRVWFARRTRVIVNRLLGG